MLSFLPLPKHLRNYLYGRWHIATIEFTRAPQLYGKWAESLDPLVSLETQLNLVFDWQYSNTCADQAEQTGPRSAPKQGNWEDAWRYQFIWVDCRLVDNLKSVAKVALAWNLCHIFSLSSPQRAAAE
jgi:hypothetical protein